MAGYKVGTQAWYDRCRVRIVEISEKLKNPETSKDERELLFNEQIDIINEMTDNWTTDLVNTPLSELINGRFTEKD